MRRRPAASLLFVVLLAAACGSNAPSSGTASTPGRSGSVSNSASASTAVSGAPSGSQAPVPSSPSDTSGPNADATPTADPSAEIPTDSASAQSPSASIAATPCQPEGNNQSFWPGIATSVSWDVYCAVLPKGWVLSSGSYRLANGGKLLVSYKGPGGASLTLSEGSFCSDGSGCVPSGSDAGAAAFGAMGGTLVTTDAGGYAIVVARGDTPSWLMVTSGLDQTTAVSLGAALARVGG
jgi:hypothetical protein